MYVYKGAWLSVTDGNALTISVWPSWTTVISNLKNVFTSSYSLLCYIILEMTRHNALYTTESKPQTRCTCKYLSRRNRCINILADILFWDINKRLASCTVFLLVETWLKAVYTFGKMRPYFIKRRY